MKEGMRSSKTLTVRAWSSCVRQTSRSRQPGCATAARTARSAGGLWAPHVGHSRLPQGRRGAAHDARRRPLVGVHGVVEQQRVPRSYACERPRNLSPDNGASIVHHLEQSANDGALYY